MEIPQWEPRCSVRTDGHDEAKSLFSKFCDRAQKQHVQPFTAETAVVAVLSVAEYRDSTNRKVDGSSIPAGVIGIFH